MAINKLDFIEFRLKELHDFTWLKNTAQPFGLLMRRVRDVFEWTEGECLFDHWNFEKYKRDTALISLKKNSGNCLSVKS